ncbi:hypothetical protein PG993_013210 [Apiospora rasikravindrae]|uniref:F-box domain-containing protein n=1 Tax=Apiospora rasikravindrae TaxID=990691 RepID=A0ABR1RX33_9PEZI
MAGLTRLPVEIHTLILSYLGTLDRKNLRLVSTHLKDKTPLQITRVFLSANSRNVEAFRAIADHEPLRKGVTEIIWDDAVLPNRTYWMSRYPREFEPPFLITLFIYFFPSLQSIYLLFREMEERVWPPLWFEEECSRNLMDSASRKDADPDTAEWERILEAHQPLPASYAYYRKLVKQQEEVLATGADIDALTYGLARFPALRRLTIAPAAHGLLHEPLYETPMIRAFPDGFNYPIPRGWLTQRDQGASPAGHMPWEVKIVRRNWRGLSAVLRALAEQEHHVTELVIDVHGLCTGIPLSIFDDPACQEYQDLVALLRRPGFRRIDVALLAAHELLYQKTPFSDGRLRRVLCQGKDLEYVRLTTDLTPNLDCKGMRYRDSIPGYKVHLQRDLFPVEAWSKLQHFGLAGFYVQQEDLLSLLAALPPSLRSVELSSLRFIDGGSYRSLLCDVRDLLPWRGRPAGERPRVAIAVGNGSEQRTVVDRVVCVEDEVYDFLYEDGPNPFGGEGDAAPGQLNRLAAH